MPERSANELSARQLGTVGQRSETIGHSRDKSGGICTDPGAPATKSVGANMVRSVSRDSVGAAEGREKLITIGRDPQRTARRL